MQIVEYRKIKMLYKSLLLLFVIFITSCNNVDLEKEKEKLLNTDIEFSNNSVKDGNSAAFLKYCTRDAVLLKPNYYPIVGKQSIKQHFDKLDTDNYNLSWRPSYAKISGLADLAYTYGIYQLEVVKGNNKGDVYSGTYLTIWQKTPQGEWRFVLDTGNSGLSE